VPFPQNKRLAHGEGRAPANLGIVNCTPASIPAKSRPMKAPAESSANKLQNGAIRRALLNWHRAHARDLPWRRTRDPYAVWVSEVMLQQTQVTTVVPYYERFLRAFPTIERLARSPFEKVAKQWSGLGYYRRARYLHSAARKVMKDFGGQFPPEYSLARQLPGVGHYTACAVLSIAYNQPLAVMDGNAARVMARLAALRGHLQQSRFRHAVEEMAQRLLSPREPGLFNQAIMELGQTVCLKGVPHCPICPVRAWCHAWSQGQPESYPQPRPRRPTEARHLATAVIRKGKRIVLTQGLDEGLLDDLWNFPAAFGSSPQEAFENLQNKLMKETLAAIHRRSPIATVQHRITYRLIYAEIYPATLRNGTRADALRWFALNELDDAPISQLTRKIAKVIQRTTNAPSQTWSRSGSAMRPLEPTPR